MGAVGAGVLAGAAGVALSEGSGSEGTGSARAALAEGFSSLSSLGPTYPRWWAFRQSETLARGGAYPDTEAGYRAWAANFALADGIEGKCLNEELGPKVLTPRVGAWFRRFKRENPAKMVLLHYNGFAHLPSGAFFAGHWLYRAGTTLDSFTEDAYGQVRLTLRDSAKRAHITAREPAFDLFPRAPVKGSYLVVAPMSGATPDFTNAEQLRVLGVQGNTVTVQRHLFGTNPGGDLTPGSFVAAHAVSGAVDGQVLWYYNFSTAAPRDVQGRSVGEVVAGQLDAAFRPDGVAAGFDGLELDALGFTAPANEFADCNNDGRVDDGVIDGVNTYGAGVIEYLTALRASPRLHDKLVLADGSSDGYSDTARLSGVEIEGFPTLSGDNNHNGIVDCIDFANWSEYASLLSFYDSYCYSSPRGALPTLSYVLGKWPIAAPGATRSHGRTLSPGSAVNSPDMPEACRRARMGIAAAVLTGSGFAPYQDATAAGNYRGHRKFEPWDELVGGRLPGTDQVRGTHWLGEPVGEQYFLVEDSSELLRAAGLDSHDSLLRGLHSTSASIERRSDGLLVTPVHGSSKSTITLPTVAVGAPGDCYVALSAQAEALQDSDRGRIGRAVTVTVEAGHVKRIQSGYATPDGDNVIRLYFGELPSGAPVSISLSTAGGVPWSLRSVKIHSGPDVRYREFTHGLVVVNTSTRPYLFGRDEHPALRDLTLRRLTATRYQDPARNSGRPVGSAEVIPASDACFWVKA